MKIAASHSLQTPDLASGVALSTELAQDLSQRLHSAGEAVPKPGGMNYLTPAPVSTELIASILLVAISLANDGWAKKSPA